MHKKKRTNWLLRFYISAGLALLLAAALTMGVARAGTNQQDTPPEKPTTDHSMLPQLAGPFESATDITAACLECHAQQADDLMATTHWTWEYMTSQGQEMGKKNVINNYCVAIDSNEGRCSMCHVGYGYKDNTFDFTNSGNIDCVICHDQTGTYKKFPTGAGHPVYEETDFNGKTWTPPDLAAVAQSVSWPNRSNCGFCHFAGGGAPGVKHGDLDPSMANPSFELDVHMDAEGLNFTCQECHVTENHDVSGSRYDMSVSEPLDKIRTCASCHPDGHTAEGQVEGYDVALAEALDSHTDKIACQTCHLPEYAREFPTKMWWDWSTAGEKDAEGKPFVTKDDNGWVVYDTKKGEFVWEMNVEPEYVWFNGATEWIELPDTVDPEQGANINTLLGGIDDEGSFIWPVKAFRGIQMYDSSNNTMAIPHLFGKDDNAYWKGWDWNNAITAGMEYAGVEYSGEYGWIDTVMYWPLTHQIGPKDTALDCQSCHSSDGRLDFEAVGYAPEMVSLLQTFPPVEPTPTLEPTATEVPPTDTPEPTPVPPTEVPPTKAPEPTEVPAGESGPSVTTWVLIIGVIVIIAVVVYFVVSRRNQD